SGVNFRRSLDDMWIPPGGIVASSKVSTKSG
ncbi:MAG: hypothetical protein ACI9MR_003855, partial [Myxococcota bacterium]